MTMTNETRARVAPAAEGPQLTEHVNVLMTEETRAFLLGSKIVDTARSEAAVARSLIEESVARFAETYPAAHARRLRAGREELARRADAASGGAE